MQPYRNEQIITIIRDMYFSGGSKSFAVVNDHCFPTHPGLDGRSHNEVPIPMVALVVTAVSEVLFHHSVV